ncbi:MAG: gamma-glutamylcyclotransferase [Parvibaculaceae bacterium]|nr:gamma-glutamylcyclotransferase [Parvibaculaceae bacterium]
MQDLWVFGYGSLMWRPGFSYESCEPARLYGYHRAFCVYSHVHRGTPEQPGLVFGLDNGGACRGLAFKVVADQAESVRQYLREREQVTMVYKEDVRPIHLLDSEARVESLCFTVDREHHQYAGKLPFDTQVKLIAEGVGQSGRNPEYLSQTVEHLREIGVHDHGLEKLWHAVAEKLGASAV